MTQPINFKSLPAEIKDKMAALEHHKHEINRLNERLEISKREVERLEAELDIYRASVAPIGKCPTEVLAAIFKAYLDENPRLIRRLLLVSKQWHGLAINTPELWTNIPIYIDSSLADAKDAAESIKPRLYACLRYSKDLLLDIDIDLEKMVLPMRYMSEKEREFREKYLGGANIDMLRRLWEGGWWGYEGKKEKMNRWRSLKIKLPPSPYDNDIFLIWERLVGSTPNLTSLFIQSPLGLDTPEGVTFTDLSSLRHLSIRGSDHLHILGVASIKKLRHLETSYYDIQILRGSSSNGFQTLRSIVFRADTPCGALPYEPDASVHLPLLHSLSFAGAYTDVHDVQFELPALKNLYLERVRPNYFIDPPNVNPQTVTWRIVPDSRYPWTNKDKQFAIRKLILHYTLVETLIVDDAVKEDLYVVIEKLREEGYSASSLGRIRVGGVGDFENLLGFTE